MRPNRFAILSSPCLWLIGVVLFLPTVRGCNAIQSPAQLIAEEPLHNGLWLSPFLVAELLAILTLIPLLRRVEPSRHHFILALCAVVPAFGSPAIFVSMLFEHTHSVQWCYAVSSVALAVAALALLIGGARKNGWQRHAHILAAFTFLTLPLAVFVTQLFIEDGPKSVAVGAYCFVAAMAGLTALTVSSWRVITRA